jgi:hypothetical protein
MLITFSNEVNVLYVITQKIYISAIHMTEYTNDETIIRVRLGMGDVITNGGRFI